MKLGKMLSVGEVHDSAEQNVTEPVAHPPAAPDREVRADALPGSTTEPATRPVLDAPVPAQR